MGIRSSRNNSSNQPSDQQRCNKLHMETHYNLIDKILQQHLTIIDSNVDAPEQVLNIHTAALHQAIRHHLDAAYFESPNYQRVREMVYTI